ncbi:MAG: ACP S-malonyltransferase [Candidatus Obscuribacterales bacterium]|nr:ACP S-malonyltransferase [Candidatus Obscuribacterales bacterium]
MAKLACVFPGQGSQSVGMGLDLEQGNDTARDTFSKIDAAAGRSLSQLCFQGPEEALKRTINTQPTILAVSLAAWAAYQKAGGPRPDFVAGHSLGEFSALCAAGVLSLEDTVRLVEKRASLMESCPKGAMTAVLGMSAEALEAVCHEVSQALLAEGSPAGGTDHVVLVANFNTREQLVISGNPEAVTRAGALVKERGGKAIPLPVGGAFHSPLMSGAAQEFAQTLKNCQFAPAAFTVVQNFDAQGSKEPQVLKEKLGRQMESAVRWTGTVEYMAANGVDTIVEIGPGKVLAGLVKKIDRQIKVFNIYDQASLTETVAALALSEKPALA